MWTNKEVTSSHSTLQIKESVKEMMGFLFTVIA
jgi:hypothetical protein